MTIDPPTDTARKSAPPVVVDALLGAAVTIVMIAVIAVDHGGRTEPDAVAYLWAVGLGVLMLVRRSFPVIVLLVSVLGLFAYYAAGYPAVGVAPPIAAALVSAAEFGRTTWAIAAGVVTLVTSVAFRLAEGQEQSLVGYELASQVLLVAAAIAVGDGVRSRRRLVAGAREIIDLTQDRAERESEARAHTERVAVARDLHDSIGHSTSVISIHADVAREAVARGDRPAADGALDLIKETTSAAMSDLRRTVTVLRTPGHGRETLSLATIGSAIDPGPWLRLTTDVETTQALPGVVDSAACRIAQEAVTNVVRHSTATETHIRASTVDGVLHLEVVDNGRPREDPQETRGTGHGTTGMRERASALGGTLETGPQDEGGFAVRAHIPLHAPDTRGPT